MVSLLLMLWSSAIWAARPDTNIVVPMPIITANTPVCENATLKLETPFQDGVIFHWYDTEDNEISVVATASVPDMQLSMAGTYRLIVEQAGCFSEPATIEIAVTPRPDTPTTASNSPICEGETLLLTSPDLPNTTYKWIDPFGTVIANERNTTINNIPKELAGDYFLEITQFGCSSPLGGTKVGIIAINEIPELTVSGPACEGDSLLIRGPRVADATYNWTGPNGFESDNVDSLLFESVNTSLNGEFSLFLEADGCRSPVGTIEVDVFAKPSVTFSGGGTICAGEETDVLISLTGSAPFDFAYTVNDVEQTPIETSAADLVWTQSPDADKIYVPIKMTDKNGCPAKLEGSASILVQERPTVSLIADTICDPINENYRVAVSVKNGASPYQFEGLEGELTDSLFFSEWIPNEASYQLTVSDENGCSSETISGSYVCPCQTDAGQAKDTVLAICGEESATIIHLSDEQLDANDQLFFVLHDSPNGLGNILASNTEPSFALEENLTTNQTYYISPIAASRVDNFLDLNDRCLSIGLRIPVTFLPTPAQPSIDGVANICPGTALELTTSASANGAVYTWETPFEILETTTPQLVIDPVSGDYSGDFRVRVTQDDCVSPASAPFILEVTIPSGQADAGSDTISCGQPTINLNAKAPDFGFGQWVDDNGAFVEDTSDPKSRVSSLQEGRNVFYWVLSTDDCPNYESDSVVVGYRPNATAVNDNFTLAEEAVFLDINVLENDRMPEDFSFEVLPFTEPNQGVVEDQGHGNFTYRRPFNGFRGNVAFEYLLCFETPTCPTQCDTAAVLIDVLLNPNDPGVYIPDGITPNGDGLNDQLIIQGIENYEQNELILFDRWGNQVFQASPYENNWDGTYQNTGLPEGAYYYILKTDVTNKETLKGRVYIIR